MSLRGLDLVAVSRWLAQIVDPRDEVVEAFFERLEILELPAGDDSEGVMARREEGVAIRLARGDESWMATVDSLVADDFLAALRRVARAWPQATGPAPDLAAPPWPEWGPRRELERFPAALNRALRRRLVAFPLRVGVRRHRRWIQLVGPQLIPEAESETFYSVELSTPWGRRGVLAPSLGEETVGEVADMLALAFEARDAGPPERHEVAVVLAPQATAIFLHEAVAHALEADTLAAGGRIEAAIGLAMGGCGLSVLDDPGSAPAGLRRVNDDEGRPVQRRWLLRDGVVEQPLADAYWAQRSEALLPGAGRRAGRLDPPAPRSTHLTLLPGDAATPRLLEGTGLWVPHVVRGRLVPATGHCRLQAACGYRFEDGELLDAVGPFAVEGSLATLLGEVEAIGEDVTPTGAGWCAKGRQRMPVWATTPSLRLGRARVAP